MTTVMLISYFKKHQNPTFQHENNELLYTAIAQFCIYEPLISHCQRKSDRQRTFRGQESVSNFYNLQTNYQQPVTEQSSTSA